MRYLDRWFGAEGGTRTPTSYLTRPSNVRVCQFRHFGKFSRDIITRTWNKKALQVLRTAALEVRRSVLQMTTQKLELRIHFDFGLGLAVSVLAFEFPAFPTGELFADGEAKLAGAVVAGEAC